METVYAKLTVCFEAPFWICLYQRSGGGSYEACKLTFGAEPGDQEVYAYLLEHWRQLPFSPPVATKASPKKPVNPKRARREVRRQTRPSAIGTKAQQALALQREKGKEAQASRSRQQREAEEARRFALHREKRKEKHKGH